jgi:hypothetical protein
MPPQERQDSTTGSGLWAAAQGLFSAVAASRPATSSASPSHGAGAGSPRTPAASSRSSGTSSPPATGAGKGRGIDARREAAQAARARAASAVQAGEMLPVPLTAWEELMQSAKVLTSVMHNTLEIDALACAASAVLDPQLQQPHSSTHKPARQGQGAGQVASTPLPARLAERIAVEFEDRYSRAWHCIVRRRAAAAAEASGYALRHHPGRYMCWEMGDLVFTLWETDVADLGDM